MSARVRMSLAAGRMAHARIDRNEIYMSVFIHRDWRYPLRV
jgi:hypothetical protein